MTAGDEGVIEFWDYRVREKIMIWQGNGEGIMEIQNSENGVVFGTGSQKGAVKLYDISDSGKLFTNIEPKCEFNRFELCANSGMILTASEEPRMGIFFVPQLDNAPKWCPFLENITEELEEKDVTTVYDEFKFLSYDDLEALNCSNLMGTKFLKSHLHGFLMHNKLYEKIKAKSDRFVLEDYKQAKIQEKLQEQTKTRITDKSKDKVVKYNKEFIEENLQKKSSSNKNFNMDTLLQDDRFRKLFTSKDFQIDKNSENYILQHPSERNTKFQKKIDSDEEIDADLGQKIQDMRNFKIFIKNFLKQPKIFYFQFLIFNKKSFTYGLG